jgi:putative flavoprotein involved in K+ transport
MTTSVETEIPRRAEPGAKHAPFTEAGAAVTALLGTRERLDVVVIGGAQAGLSVGYHLARAGLRFVILDGGARIGDSWRQRWDSLRLFTPARLDGLDGLPFPAPAHAFPTKDEMADYLERYADHFRLPVRTGMKVTRVCRDGAGYLVEANGETFAARHVVVAMATYQQPSLPAYAGALDGTIVQLPARDYRNPGQLRPGPVLIAGAGNSGAEIALELGRAGHHIFMAGRDVGAIPFRMSTFIGHHLGRFVLRVVFHRLLTVRTPIGRKVRPKAIAHGGPLIRVKSPDLKAVGVERTPRVMGVKDGRPLLEDGHVLDVANVVWCTGYRASHGFLELPIFDAQGEPRHEGGVVAGQPGLYFVGLHFGYAMSSTMIHGVGRDARRIAKVIRQRLSATRSAPADGRAAAGLDADDGAAAHGQAGRAAGLAANLTVGPHVGT